MPSMTLPSLRDPRYARMLAENKHDQPDGFLFACDRLFDGVSLQDKTVLEIGSGTGLLSIYMAIRGARVTSLEPELAGATGGVMATQQARCAELGLTVECINADFNTWESTRKFDVIVSRSSINHLCPTEHHARRHEPTWNQNVVMLRKVKQLMRPGGVFVATDTNRYAFWLLVRRWVDKPWKNERSGVNWRHHQNALTWAKLLKTAGFSTVERDYVVPHRMKQWSPLIRNALASFFLKGTFILRAR
jgi:SAM-dependent methyltransferase